MHTSMQTNTDTVTPVIHTTLVLCPDKPPVWPCRPTFLGDSTVLPAGSVEPPAPLIVRTPRASCPIHLRKSVQSRRAFRAIHRVLWNVFPAEVLFNWTAVNNTWAERTGLFVRFYESIEKYETDITKTLFSSGELGSTYLDMRILATKSVWAST